MSIYLIPTILIAIGLANMVLLWREAPISGLITLLGLSGLGLGATDWFNSPHLPSTFVLSAAGALTTAIGLYSAYSEA